MEHEMISIKMDTKMKFFLINQSIDQVFLERLNRPQLP